MKKRLLKNLTCAATVHFYLLSTTMAGPGHDHGPVPGEQTSSLVGPVQISPQAKANLRLETSPVRVATLHDTLFAIGQIDAIPEKRSQISSRIPGQVKALLVSEGEYVEEGALLAKVESRLPGDPPPVIEFRAPQSGVITNLHVFKGTNIEPNAHLMDVVDLSEVYARAQVYEGQVSGLELGQQARIRLEAYQGKVFDGLLERLSTSVDEESRTLNAWFRVENPEQLIRLNMRATFDIVVRESKQAVVIPKEALLGQNGNMYVFVVKDEAHLIYEKVPVVVGISDDRYVEVKEGVYRDSYVVTTGNYQLQYLPVLSPAELEAHHREFHDYEEHDHAEHLHDEHLHEEEEHAHEHGDHSDHDHGDLDESRWFELLEGFEEQSSDPEDHGHPHSSVDHENVDVEGSHGHDHETEHDHLHTTDDSASHEDVDEHSGHDHGHEEQMENSKLTYWKSVYKGFFALSVLLNIGFIIAWSKRNGRLNTFEKGE